MQYWTWWVLAVALIGLEMAAPGAALMWIGFAAAAVGLVLLVIPDLTLNVQLLIFSIGTLAAIFGVRAWMRFKLREQRGEREGEDHPHLNRRAEHYIGTVHRLTTAIEGGRGRARVDDGSWTVQGPDLPVGATVRVVAVRGVILEVEPAEPCAPAAPPVPDQAAGA